MRKRIKDIAHIFSRILFNQVARPLTDRQYVLLRHYMRFGRFPNLDDPKLYNEKIAWRMLFDRRQIFRQVTDKLAMREYAKNNGLDEYLPKLIFETSDPHEIPFDLLPKAFVVKASHGSGMVLLVSDKQKLDIGNFYNICKKWLRYDYYFRAREWQYHNIPRRIIVEEFLGGGISNPSEYKFHCFDGEPKTIGVFLNRYTPQFRSGRFDMDWSPLKQYGPQKGITNFSKPDRLNELVQVARLFSSGFDYVRVDLYLLPERVVFGELTLTTSAGLEQLPFEYQGYLGELWKLKNR